MNIKNIFMFFIICCGYEFFSLGNWWHRSGVFNVADVGNIILCIIVLPLIIFSRDKKVIFNPISGLIVIYLFMTLLQVVLAAVYYGQSIFDGLIAVRLQFYYLSYFIFLVLLQEEDIMLKFLNGLSLLAVILVILSVINYFGPTIFFHKWASGQGIRGGITRAFIPGMGLVSFTCIWVGVRWISSPDTASKKNKLASLLLLAAHFFRQSRMRLIGVLLVIGGMLFVKKRWKPFIALGFVSVLTFFLLEAKLGKDVMLNLFKTSYEDVAQQKGTMRPRLGQLKVDLQEFGKHPVLGSGLAAIRYVTKKGGTRLRFMLKERAYKSDLGYTHWLKFYGILGVLWLMAFFGIQIKWARDVVKRSKGNNIHILSQFCLSYLIFVVFSFFTLNHLMFPWGILPLCLAGAILSRLHYLVNQDDCLDAPK